VPATDDAVAAAFRDEWGKVVATLIRRTGDWDVAEECASEAFAEALRRWPVDGVPARPGAWLTTVAGNRAIDRLRRAARGAELLEEVGRDRLRAQEDEDVVDDEVIEDDRLRLIFTCCHPALALEARVALTLRSLAGLTTAEIARAFLVPEATMAKRLTRAKGKIAQAGIPYRVPPAHLLPERLGGVLAVVYLLFNQGYSAASPHLSEEAIRLGRALVELMPDEPEAAGLLALMLFHHSRRFARLRAGEIVTLEEQDRAMWDAEEIAEARARLEGALRRGAAGPYQLQAAIAACHVETEIDWGEVTGLYELLLDLSASPVLELNRAVAVAMRDGVEHGLALVDQLTGEGTLAGYHLLPATRADFLRRLGRAQEAAEAYREALALAPTDAERRFLERRLEQL
jgi:RNA polymerase sigma-70 factor, ECF subfamily